MSSSSSASWLNACVGRSEWSLHLSPEQSLASIRAASGGASATEWEQNRPDCVGREALARDQVHLKPPLILQCTVELLYSPNTTPNTCLDPIVRLKALLSAWAVQMVRHSAFISKLCWAGEMGDWCESEKVLRRWRLHVVNLIFCWRGIAWNSAVWQPHSVRNRDGTFFCASIGVDFGRDTGDTSPSIFKFCSFVPPHKNINVARGLLFWHK